MGALASLMIEAADAINKLGRDKARNEGWEFKTDSSTWSCDDFVIRGGGGEDFVLAVTWANPPYMYKPSLPNLRMSLDKVGWQVVDKKEYERLKEIEEKYNKLMEQEK